MKRSEPWCSRNPEMLGSRPPPMLCHAEAWAHALPTAGARPRGILPVRVKYSLAMVSRCWARACTQLYVTLCPAAMPQERPCSESSDLTTALSADMSGKHAPVTIPDSDTVSLIMSPTCIDLVNDNLQLGTPTAMIGHARSHHRSSHLMMQRWALCSADYMQSASSGSSQNESHCQT